MGIVSDNIALYSKKKGFLMDIRTQKTKACILQAMIKLLEKKALDDITITEIAETANINRKTFYAHYNSIQDVIEETGNEIADNLLTLCKEMSNDYSILNPDILFRCLNILANGNPEQFGAIFGNTRNTVILHQFTDILCQHIQRSLEDTSTIKLNNEAYVPFVAAFIAGGLMNTYREWGKKNPEVNLDEVTQLTSRLIISGIQSELNHSLLDSSH